MTAKYYYDKTVETLRHKELKALQWAKLEPLLHHVYKTNDFYRRHWDAAGIDLSKVTSFEAFSSMIPTVEKADFLADQTANPPQGTRLSNEIGPADRLEYYTTSGTSGQGSEIHIQTIREIAEMVKMYSYGFTWAGLKPGDLAVMTLPLTMMAGGRVEYDGGLGFGLTTLPIGNYEAKQKLSLIERFKPTVLYGSTTYFMHLAAVAETDVKESSIKVMLTGLEGGSIPYIERLEEVWGAKAFDRFGSAQMRSDHMFTCERGFGTVEEPGVLHNIDPYAILEVLDLESGQQVSNGEYGEIIITSLYHQDVPLIRCQMRDGGIFRSGNSCSCGREMDGLQVCSIGRTDDVKKIKGVNVYPQALDKTVFAITEVDEYVVRLTSSSSQADIATVTAMLKSEIDESQGDRVRDQLEKDLHQNLGIHFEVIIGPVERSDYKTKRWIDERDR
jgi:phenylacetate-CoA ligase